MFPPILVARAEATNSTGAGHAMRCLGVLERWIKAGGRVELWGTIEIDFVRLRAERAGVPVVDLRRRGSLEEVVSALSSAVTRARPLPKLQPGAGAVVQELSALIDWSP